ncbi:MAG: LysM peptidoglycan-binding domain-containing protein [Rhodocyclales bacterium]|nr:LysM peptidoglycan-binding domain-containing protein [Rhodocyclales bacterium]
MRRIISALFVSLSTTLAVAQGGTPIELAPDAPDRHIVVPGDTLWGIASRFLKDPYRWPEVWRLNDEQVRNPHRIYPGQVIVLDRSGLGGDPQLKLGNLHKAEPRIYSTSDRDAIPAIPPNVIEPFLAQPLVIEEGALSGESRVVATDEGRVNAGQGNKLEAIYLGDARLTREADGDEATTLEVTKGKIEIGRGDFLKVADKPELLNYVPRAPRAQIKGKIVSIYGGVGEAGQFSIVAISRGKRDGVELGHVLAISRTGQTVTNRFEDKAESIRLPDERYGLLFVFRVFEKVSYALVMESSRPVIPHDTVATP